ncbi:GNAT family N-acetyltransferase [Clostridium polynesiense]|uniref:GNAT family N-acetyltransferase n=1 Tax=Clostridium polynesiense TaxID=1325933 RepID=UPI00058E38E6|nr:N-acetyltransferase [Clostridium polynesiense]
MEVKVVLASEIGDKVRNEMGYIFTEGFYQWIKYFSKDKGKLAAAFKHMFLLNQFYVSLDEDKAIGFAGVNKMNHPTVKLISQELRRNLGLIKGTIAYMVLRKEFENKVYPLELNDNCGAIEFVAIAKDYRGKGIGKTIINHIFALEEFNEYVLEVADSNLPALALYSKLGFKEIKRIPTEHGDKSGVNYYIYMKYNK